MPNTFFTYNTPIGHVTIASDGTAVTEVAYGLRTCSGERKPTALTNNAATEIQEYFAGKRRLFTVPVAFHGSDYQNRVWELLMNIPYGSTRTFAQVAESLGKPKGGRSVAAACSANPVSIIVPSHRVVGANGKPSGDAASIRIKEFLLNLEQEHR